MASVEVVFPYEPTDRNQLALKVGEKISVIQKNPTGWWIGQNSMGDIGIFPCSYTQEANEKPKFVVPQEQKTLMLSQSQVLSPLSFTERSLGGSIVRMGDSPRQAALRESLGLDPPFDANTSFASPPKIESLARMRFECKSLKEDLKKMNWRASELQRLEREAIDKKIRQQSEVQALKPEIQMRSDNAARLERVSEVLHALLEGVEPASYPIDQLVPQQMMSPARAASPESTSTEDPLAKKLLKKLTKRITEAEQTATEYAKQERRLRKKRNRLKDAIGHVGDEAGPKLGIQPAEARAAQETNLCHSQLRQIADEIARLSEQREMTFETEVSLRKEIKKLQKRLAKGTEANKQLEEELDSIETQLSENATTSEKRRQHIEKLRHVAAEVTRKTEEVTSQRLGEQAALKARLDHVKKRVQVEHSRVQELQKTLMDIQKAQQEHEVAARAAEN